MKYLADKYHNVCGNFTSLTISKVTDMILQAFRFLKYSIIPQLITKNDNYYSHRSVKKIKCEPSETHHNDWTQ